MNSFTLLLVAETVNSFQKGSDAAFKTLTDICQIVKQAFPLSNILTILSLFVKLQQRKCKVCGPPAQPQ